MNFLSRFSVFLVLVLFSLLFLAAGARIGPGFYWGLVATLPLSLMGVYDLLQRRHSLWRIYPVTSHIRWLFEDLRPYLRQYIVEGNLTGRPYNREQRTIVYARAKGQEDYHAFGSDLDVYSHEYEWFSQSITPAAPVAEDLRLDIGGPQCSRPYNASIFNISAMSFGSLGRRAVEALNLGARRGNFFHDTGEGGISPYHVKHGGDLVWEIGTGYFGCRTADGRFDPERFRDRAQQEQVKMIEIKLSQGAKPGHGGVLPGEKVTREIAATRDVPLHQDCLSPAAHSTFSTPQELLDWAAGLREMSGGKPVGVKLCVGQPHEVFALVKAMKNSGVYLDYIVVDGAEGGTGAAPQEFSDHMGMPLREGLIIMRNALVGSGLKKHVRLAASGKIHNAYSIAANCALGADWCNAARPFMFALGCVMTKKCHTGKCPTGVATQDPLRQYALVVPDKAERVARYHERTLHNLKELLAATGVSHPGLLRPGHLYHRVSPVEVRMLDSLYPFLEADELLAGTAHDCYRAWWDMASADSFAPLGKA